MRWLFLHIVKLCSSGRGSFLALSAAGRAGGPRPRYKFGPRLGFVVRALGVQSRAIWLFFYGNAFRRAKATQDSGNPRKKWPSRFRMFWFVKQLAPRLVAWPPRTSSVVAWPPGTSTLLACNNSHASSSFLRATVLLCVCVRGRQMYIFHKQRCNWMRFGDTAVDPFIEG